MRRAWPLTVLAVACGSRTGLDVGIGGDDSPMISGDGAAVNGDGAASNAGGATNGGQGALCSFYLGPVDSCDAGPAESIERCDPTFPICVDVGGRWGCCVGASPFNGPSGNCRFGVDFQFPDSFACP